MNKVPCSFHYSRNNNDCTELCQKWDPGNYISLDGGYNVYSTSACAFFRYYHFNCRTECKDITPTLSLSGNITLYTKRTENFQYCYFHNSENICEHDSDSGCFGWCDGRLNHSSSIEYYANPPDGCWDCRMKVIINYSYEFTINCLGDCAVDNWGIQVGGKHTPCISSYCTWRKCLDCNGWQKSMSGTREIYFSIPSSSFSSTMTFECDISFGCTAVACWINNVMITASYSYNVIIEGFYGICPQNC